MKRTVLTQHRCNGRHCAVCASLPAVIRWRLARAAQLDPSITTTRTPAWRVPEPRREV